MLVIAKRLVVCSAVLLATGAWGGSNWEQWGQSAAHDGQSSVCGQAPATEKYHHVYDPFAGQEMAETWGDLFVHYQAPLTDDAGDWFMMQKQGRYKSCDPPGSWTPAPCGIDPANVAQEVWAEKGFHFRHDGRVEERWSFASDWKPFPVYLWEPMFQSALSGPFIYIPGAGGSVWQVLKANGQAVQRINPFPTVDANTWVTSGITVDALGFVYWNVIQRDPTTYFAKGYLVRATPWGTTRKVAYDGLVPDAPAQNDLCYYSFDATYPDPPPPRPWPPAADALPPQYICGAQRPGVNVTPAIGADGTIFLASRADFNPRYSYLIALRPDLSLAWATSLRGLVHDGCGVHRDGPEGDVECSASYAEVGVEPATNLPPALTVDDDSSSSPVALPDGGVIYGALDGYNFSRGHLVDLDRRGRFRGSYGFGWDTTPAIYRHDGTYSIVMKDNHYWSEGPFYITQLSKDLRVEWQFQNTEHEACTRLPDGTISCSDTSPDGEEHENGFEWCVNAPAVDAHGDVFVNAEDGHVYRIGQGGVLRDQVFLNQALGAAYTPIALDREGRSYVLNNGELSVRGR